ncbi:MAG TPA: sulfatase [Thermoanaerobaculia bacterium]|nr:sulfatase [Thermoanaerobaculia bacterium]
MNVRIAPVLRALWPAAGLAGALVGLVQGWHYLDSGFPTLVVGRVLDAVLMAWLLAVLFGFSFLLAEPLVAGLLRGRGESRWPWLAAGLAAAPVLVILGLYANRAWGFRPAELLTASALLRNGLLVAAVLAAALVFGHWRRRRLEDGEARPASLLPVVATLAGVLLLARFGLPAWYRAGAAPDPQTPVLILLVDALRADGLGVYGNLRPASPAIDAFARDAVLFRQAIAQSTFTKTSIASLLTARNPYHHGLYWGSHVDASGVFTSDLLAEEELTLAEILREKDYLTTAWVQNSHLRESMGFAQGFVDFFEQQGSIARIHRRSSPFFSGPGRRYPFFAYLHYIDLHDPYRPKPPYDRMWATGRDVYAGIDLAEWGAFLDQVRKGQRAIAPEDLTELRALYDGQIRAIDEEIGRLVARLKASGLYEKSLIVLTADHGDGFGEHGFIGHSTAPYEELVRVPLLVKLPGGRAAGTVVEEQVRLIDVAPTILDALGYKVRPSMDGCSLLPLIDGSAAVGARPVACTLAVTEIAEEEGYPGLSLRTGRWKLIHREKKGDELYDLVADPGETVNRIAEADEEGRRLAEAARAIVASRKANRGGQILLDPKTIQELKALGYVR